MTSFNRSFPTESATGPHVDMDDEQRLHLELLRKAEAEEQTRAARWGFLARFEREADPDRVLPEEERHARGVALRREYMRKLGARSGEVRRERALRLGNRVRERDGGAGLR